MARVARNVDVFSAAVTAPSDASFGLSEQKERQEEEKEEERREWNWKRKWKTNHYSHPCRTSVCNTREVTTGFPLQKQSHLRQNSDYSLAQKCRFLTIGRWIHPLSTCLIVRMSIISQSMLKISFRLCFGQDQLRRLRTLEGLRLGYLAIGQIPRSSDWGWRISVLLTCFLVSLSLCLVILSMCISLQSVHCFSQSQCLCHQSLVSQSGRSPPQSMRIRPGHYWTMAVKLQLYVCQSYFVSAGNFCLSRVMAASRRR